MGKSKAVAENMFNIQIIVALAILVISGFGLANPAHAQQTDADFSAYCRANFNNSAYQKFAQTWGTEHACVQGGTRQGIDLGEACFLTTGSRSYEVSGQRVLCDGNPSDAPAANENDKGQPDFARYCNENFANSAYEKRPEPTGVKHYCRRPGATGGFTLQPVDLAVACQITQGVSQYRIAGARVFCTSGSGGGGNPPSDDGGGGGNGTSPDPNGGPANPTPDNPTTSNPANPNESAACQTLGGKWHGDTLTLVDKISEELRNRLLTQCPKVGVGCQALAAQVGEQGYTEVAKIYQCHLSFVRTPEGKSTKDINQAVLEVCEIEPLLNLYWEFRADVDESVSGSPPHYESNEFDQTQMAKLCNCEAEDIPDFGARVEELKQQAEQELIAEFSE